MVILKDSGWCQIRTAFSIGDVNFPKLWDGVLLSTHGVWDSLTDAPWPAGWRFEGWDAAGAGDPVIMFLVDDGEHMNENTKNQVISVLQSVEENLRPLS